MELIERTPGGDGQHHAHPGAALGARFSLGGIPEGWHARVAEIRAWEAPVKGWLERQPLEEYADRVLALPEAGHG